MENTDNARRKIGGDPLRSAELAAFCAQIGMILRAGIPVDEGLSIMAQDIQNPKGRALLDALIARVEVGAPLHMALAEVGAFPNYMVDMTEIGERAGRLDDVMHSLGAYYEREEAISKNIRSAVTYPLIMIGLMLTVIAVLIVQVMPIFSQVFEQLGAEMTFFSRQALSLGRWLGRYSYAILLTLAAAAAAFSLLRSTTGGRRVLGRLKRSLFRGLSGKIASERFASAMSLMLASGLDIDRSLEMCERLVENPIVLERIGRCKALMHQGSSFPDALVQAGLFTGVHGRMVAVGFKAGAIDSVMEKLALAYSEEIDSQIGNTIAMLEPTLVAILSIIVGMILLSIMLPLMGIMSSIG